MVLSWGCGKNEGGTSSQNIQSEETMNMSEVQTSEVQEPAVQTFPDSYYYESDMLKIRVLSR
jgi:hypothetical protein